MRLLLVEDDEPLATARLLASIGSRLAERLRESGRQQRLYHQLMRAMQDELDEVNRQLQYVMAGSAQRQGPGESRSPAAASTHRRRLWSRPPQSDETR